MRGIRGLVVLFVLTVVAPGIVLAILGVRGFMHERQLTEQQWQQRLDRAAAGAVADVRTEINRWMVAIDQAAAAGTPQPDRLPDALRRATSEPGVAVILLSGSADQAWPLSALAYSSATPPLWRPSDSLVAAEALELTRLDYRGAIGEYQLLLQSAPDDDRAWLLHRLARTLRKAGQPAAAARALDALQVLQDAHVEGLPADFLARYERCAAAAGAKASPAKTAGAAVDTPAALLRGLASGRWSLDEPRYRYYAAQLRTWAVSSGAADATLADIASIQIRREALTAAVTSGSEPDRPGRYLVLRGDEGMLTPRRAALVIDGRWLTDHLQSNVVTAAAGGLLASVSAADGGASDDAAASRSADLHSVRNTPAGGVTWTVDVRPESSAALAAETGRRQRAYVALLAGAVIVMGFGTYLTARVVRRELEIARMKSDFVAAVSHEFRSPLTGIRQLGEMLARGRVPSEARRQEYYERITKESDRLSRVVENLLDFARMEERRRAYRFERVDAREWLSATIDTFAGQEPHRSHRIVTTIADRLPALAIDREALATAIDNVLDNAVKYSPDAEEVWVEAEPDAGGIVIRVRDRGVGIAPSDQAHIFERFYRGKTSASANISGTGLGLSLVRHIVKAHGGRVTLKSESGVGTTVSIHLCALS